MSQQAYALSVDKYLPELIDTITWMLLTHLQIGMTASRQKYTLVFKTFIAFQIDCCFSFTNWVVKIKTISKCRTDIE